MNDQPQSDQELDATHGARLDDQPQSEQGLDGTQGARMNDQPQSDQHCNKDVNQVDDTGLASVQETLPSRCIIHVQPDVNAKILPWQIDKWSIAIRAAEARKKSKNFQTSKYKDVIEALPEDPGQQDGYHSKCYKNITAIPMCNPVTDNVVPEGKILRSATASPVPNKDSNEPGTSVGLSTVGIFPYRCLFCDKKVKKKPDGTKEYPGKLMTKSAENKIREVVGTLKLVQLQVKISGVDLIAKEAVFHHSCRSMHIRRADRVGGFGLKPIPEEPINSKLALDKIYAYVKVNTIDGKRPERLTSIYDQYLDLCTELEVLPTVGKAQYLGELLTKKFEGELTLHSPESRKQGVIVHNAVLEYNSIKTVYDFKSSPEGQVVKAALKLRQTLKAVKKTPLSNPLTVEAVKQGEGEPPDLVKTFFQTLLGGPTAGEYSDAVNRRSDSMSQDALFLVNNGSIKTRKHILMGLTLKSLTGSKKIVSIMNRMGHSLNYHAIEEIETDLAYAILERQLSCPAGTVPGIACGLAFDNYDELTHTLSGLDTLHDTMGILYQTQSIPCTEPPTAPPPQEGSQTEDDHRIDPPLPSKVGRKRRMLGVPSKDLQPYRKKPRMNNFAYKNTDFRSNREDLLTPSRKSDFLWMVHHAMGMEDVPMWTGFNSQTYTDHLPKQQVLYLPNINQSPTNDDVVVETLSITQKCADECEQPYGVVTYDLDVAKRAVKIQATEQPRFDNIFVMFGVFHLQMCIFKAIGVIIRESGIPEMLVESGVLASGSLRGFLECKSFNRCKRLHPMLALGFQILHFREFCEQHQDDVDNLRDILHSPLDTKDARNELCARPEFDIVFNEYDRYSKSTLDGAHGPTAKFYMQYIEKVSLYLIIDRAVRECDIDLYTWALTRAIDIFFGTNRINYARWISKHQLDILNLPSTHPGLKEMLSNGLFSIRRTENQFSRVPIDLTLEQTVNADAASRMTGYIDSTNNFNARLRWSATKGARAASVSALLEMAGMTKAADSHAQLSPSRIARDNKDLSSLLSTIQEGFANPFTVSSESLVNIQTGKAASAEISASLLNIDNKGREKHDAFISECIDDPERFEKPISKNPLKTFANQGARNKRATNPIVKELRCTRDLFGRIAIIATKKKVDMEYLLQYPLTPVPLTMCRTDGTLVYVAHGNKADLFRVLEEKISEHGSPSHVEASIIDGNFLLHCLPPLPPTYGGLSETFLQQAMKQPSKRVDVVFDTYEEPSIKDNERERRGVEDTIYLITGPEQVRPRNLQIALKSRSFKQQLPRFLVKDWGDKRHITVLNGRELYVGVETECFRFTVMNDEIEVTNVTRLECNHPEADTRICLHAVDADMFNQGPRGDIVVRASDTDVAVILLHHSHRMKLKVWMDVGTKGKGDRRYVCISSIAEKIGPKTCEALPGFHAYTGCDYTASFIRKGKKRPLKLLEDNKDYLAAFAALSTNEINQQSCDLIKEFTSKLYGAKKAISLNAHRYHRFNQLFGPKKGKGPFSSLKGADSSSLPPCENVVQQKIYRSNFVARTWHLASEKEVPKKPHRGWELVDNSYQIVWFIGPQMPDTVVPQAADLDEDSSDETSIQEGLKCDSDSEDSDTGLETDDDKE